MLCKFEVELAELSECQTLALLDLSTKIQSEAIQASWFSRSYDLQLTQNNRTESTHLIVLHSRPVLQPVKNG
jgi:hypothetical protein